MSETLFIDGNKFSGKKEKQKSMFIYSCRNHNINSLYMVIRIEKTLEKAKYKKYTQFYTSNNEATVI